MKNETRHPLHNGKSGSRARYEAYALSIIFLSLATLVVSFASRTPPATGKIFDEEMQTPSAEAMEALNQAERNWATAHVRGDGTILRRLLAEDFVSTDGQGIVRNGNNYLKAITSLHTRNRGKQENPEPAVDIRVYQRLAVVVGQTKQRGKTERFAHVYYRTGAKWQMIASQATRIKG